MCTRVGSGVAAQTMAGSDELCAFRLGQGVKWREYDDGIVVYVPATCETHILQPHFAAFFRASELQSVEPVKGINTVAQSSGDAAGPGLSGQFAEELVLLKIFDAGN